MAGISKPSSLSTAQHETADTVSLYCNKKIDQNLYFICPRTAN